MKKLVKRNLVDVLNDLPEMCALTHIATGEPIFVKRGETGYWPARPDLDVDAFNEHLGVTPAQKIAMEMGSFAGFHVPGADPLNHQDLNAKQ